MPPLDIEHVAVNRSSRYAIDSCAPQKQAVASGKIQLHALTHGHYPGRLLPTRVLPGLSSLGYWDACGEQDWGLDSHRNEGIEIVFLETGHMTFSVDDSSFPLDPGAVTVTRPWQLHRLGDPAIGPGRLHWLILDVGVQRPNQPWHWPPWIMLAPSDLQELTRKLRHNEHPVWRSTPDIEHAFRELARCVQTKSAQVEVSHIIIHINHLLLSLLEALLSQCRQENRLLTSRRRAVECFLHRLARQMDDAAKPWTLALMAKECGMGTTAFAQHCRRLTNQSPIEYLNRCRLELAAKRLRNEPDTPVTDIAFDCGFTSSQYFATCFRCHFHCPPTSYR